MLARLRRKLRLISYYSASRRRDVWSVARDRAMLVALLLALPIPLIAESLRTSEHVIDERLGGLVGDAESGALSGHVFENREAAFGGAWSGALAQGTPWGEWRVVLREQHRGWPFPSKAQPLPARVDLNDFSRAGVRKDVTLAPDSEIRRAIEEALRTPEHRHILSAWREDVPVPRGRDWLATIVSTAVWWVVLSVVFIFMVQIARGVAGLTALRGHGHRAVLRSDGRCATCGYDLRGLEYSDRCPECGTLLH